MIVRFLSSLRLTLALLLGLAVTAVFGTIWPSRQTDLDVFRFELYYQSFWYRLILLLLAVNLVTCTLQLIRRRWQERERLFAQLEPGSSAAEATAGCDLPELQRRLRQSGYRVEHRGELLLARKGLPSRWGVIVVHLSVLLIMAGSLVSGLGFVGTLSIYEHDTKGAIFDWQAQADKSLGFALRLDDFEPVFYPITLRFAAIDPADGREVAVVEAREGETVDLPMAGLRARVESFDPFLKRLSLAILHPDGSVQPYVSQSGMREPDNTVDGLVLYPLAFRDPIIKQQRSRVTIFRPDQPPVSGLIEVNHPLQVNGYTIYQSAYGRDEHGNFYSGFQITSDPGAPLVWAGCITLVLGLLMNLCFDYRALGARQVGGEATLSVLAGFRRGGRAEALATLLGEDLTLKES